MENTYVMINHGRIYKEPLTGPNPKGMTAWFDRRVFAERGYKVTGCMSTYNIQCVKLDPDNRFDQSIIRQQENMDRRFEEMMDSTDEDD
jgi:hypothetical protein